jgi:hypothetical protein
VPSYLTAFTANTGELVIDNQAPTIAAASVNGTQVQANTVTPVDVLDATPAAPPAFTYRNGQPLVLTFTATDAPVAGSGLETMTSDDPLELTVLEAAVLEDLALSATNGTTTLSTYTVTAAKVAGVVTYTVTLTVPTGATNGTYQVTGAVRDRSGNWSATANLGSFKIANEVLATVELQGFVGGNRDVVFVATSSAGLVLKTWAAKTVTFTASVGTVPLEDVPAGTAAISAKTAWNLRSKATVPFTPEGVGAVSLTGAKKLRGGDLNGDNVVNLLDYSILRYHWYTVNPVADIDGNGEVTLPDYSILAANFYQLGDPR